MNIILIIKYLTLPFSYERAREECRLYFRCNVGQRRNPTGCLVNKTIIALLRRLAKIVNDSTRRIG